MKLGAYAGKAAWSGICVSGESGSPFYELYVSLTLPSRTI